MFDTESTTSRPLEPLFRVSTRNVSVGRKPPGKTGHATQKTYQQTNKPSQIARFAYSDVTTDERAIGQLSMSQLAGKQYYGEPLTHLRMKSRSRMYFSNPERINVEQLNARTEKQ